MTATARLPSRRSPQTQKAGRPRHASPNPTAARWARRLGLPLSRWPGNCTAVATGALTTGLARGTLRRGHWLGPVSHRSLFARRPIVAHTWIERDDGVIIDPTRWVFEGRQPYVFVGRDPAGWYDVGGNRLRAARHGPPPAPTPTDHEVLLARLAPASRAWLLARLTPLRPLAEGGLALTLRQAFWLANTPLDQLGPLATPLFQALDLAGRGALIPYDNRARVLPETVPTPWGARRGGSAHGEAPPL